MYKSFIVLKQNEVASYDLIESIKELTVAYGKRSVTTEDYELSVGIYNITFIPASLFYEEDIEIEWRKDVSYCIRLNSDEDIILSSSLESIDDKTALKEYNLFKSEFEAFKESLVYFG